VPRPLDGNTNGVARCDLGAFEFAHPQADTDGDRMLDPAELMAGTDPTDMRSVLRATVRLLAAQGPVAVSWPSVLGRMYCVEHATDLPPGAGWQMLSNNIPANGGVIEVQDALPSSSNRLYRVGLSKVAPSQHTNERKLP
jgi:hypothetical protein